LQEYNAAPCPVQIAVINPFMLLSDWTELLPAVLLDLCPLHKEISSYLLSQTGKRRPTYCHALKTWGLAKRDFDHELATTMSALRNGLKRRGVHRFQDLDLD
jgi:hypothetical protein